MTPQMDAEQKKLPDRLCRRDYYPHFIDEKMGTNSIKLQRPDEVVNPALGIIG